jgi:hypothetical protein
MVSDRGIKTAMHRDFEVRYEASKDYLHLVLALVEFIHWLPNN